MFINLTPHALTLRSPSGEDTIIPPSGTIARVATTPGVREDRGLPVPVQTPDVVGDVTGLPEPVPGTLYLVSGFVGGALKGSGRVDVLVPGTGPRDEAVRNEKGHIVAVTCLKAVC